MDFSSLKEQVSNLTLYDLKAGVRKVQNAVMNFTEMEAKVREATNNDAWGASSQLMQEIANGTFNYSQLNEIMPMIYKRFTDKSAEEWRQIYKALQLLEYLVKNGSERVVDDARSHMTLLKMLRQFHYIDQNGKDQGINVRNRAKELAELLSDVDRIRAERKKSRATRNKYGGVEGGSMGSMSGGSSRYGGFGSGDLSYGGYSGGVYGDGGGFGGSTGGFRDSSSRRDRFEEYDEYDEGAVAAPSRRAEDTSSASSMRKKGQSAAKKLPEAPKPKAPEVDLLSVGDDDGSTTTTGINGPQTGKSSSLDNGMGALQSGGLEDDDFDDFQSATPVPQPAASVFQSLQSPPRMPVSSSSISQLARPTPSSGTPSGNLNNLVGLSPTSSTTPSTLSGFSSSVPPMPQQRQPAYQPAQPNYFTSVPSSFNQPPSNQHHPNSTAATKFTTTNKPSSSSSSGDAFGSLWSTASAGIKKPNTSTNPSQKGPNLASMAKEKASAGIWGATTQQSPQQQRLTTQGSQASKPAPGGTTGGGLDDLLG
ncbi:MAG: Epsin-3, clathrin recruitment and traffic between the Golgi and endosome [Peltula sp. TS41687]|nr:MAG: Epsin-3, clathrin recruitment and traffic between the Golgi and endosome [Peltula sp. TS41687]